MVPEKESKQENLLDDVEAEQKETQAAQYRRKVKRGRAVIIIIALLNMVTFVDGLGAYANLTYKVRLAATIAAFYAVLFVISLQKAYIAFLIGTIAYVLVGTYTLATELYMYKFLFNPAVSVLQQAAVLITMLIRVALFVYLVNATMNAREYEVFCADDK